MNLRQMMAPLMLIAACAAAQAPGRIQTPTRQVAIFTNLENQLMDAVTSGNRAGAMRLVVEDFSLWTPQPPGSAVAAEEWMSKAAGELIGFQIRQLAVKDLGEHAAASFVLLTPAKAWFVVDIWQKDASGWRLLERYQSPVERSLYSARPRPTGKQ